MVDGNDGSTEGPVGPETLGWLLDRYAAGLTLYARQLCDCADDVVQEALIALAAEPHRPDDLLAWLYRVVRNKALSAARAATRRRRREQAAAAARPDWFTPAPDDRLDAAAVAAALASLPGEQREVVVARLWGGLTFQQIAGLLGVSDSAAHRRYQTALETLRERLGTPCLANHNPRN
jgi:RNA polymerase sigma-70 factor (ECF subfamily)